MRTVRYTIVVRGRLSERFVGAFPHAWVEEWGPGATAIATEPLDLSQFCGSLEQLRDLAVEVVSVQESAPAGAEGATSCAP